MLKHDKKINGYQYTCRVCQETFILRGDLDRHMDSHWGQKRYSCDLCPKSFDGKRTLINHKLTHTKDRKRYPCDLCDKSFVHEWNVEQHRKTHFEEKKRYPCDICGRSYTSKSNVRSHQRYKHKIKLDPLPGRGRPMSYVPPPSTIKPHGCFFEPTPTE